MRKICFVLLLLTLLLSGCKQNSESTKNTFTIAGQYGIAYAPLNIMQELHLLEKKLPDTKIVWKQYGGPTAIRESMLNGSVDFGFMGVCPVLIGIDNGMDWKYATGISFNEVAIVTDQAHIQSLADFSPKDRIAVISPGATQHVLLSMLAKKELGDSSYFDEQIVGMSHPDALNALLADTEITAHVSTPPYIQEEIKQGMHVIATGEDMVGEPFTFISGVAMTDFYENSPQLYNAFIEALDEAIDYINHNPEEAAKLLANLYEMDEEELLTQMSYNGTIYSNRIEGIETISKAMEEMGFIKKAPDLKDIIFDNVNK